MVSASLELDIDSGWLNNRSVLQNDQGEYELDYKPAYENIEEDMKLTDMDLVMPLAKEGRRSALLGRDERLGIVKAVPGELTDPLLFSSHPRLAGRMEDPIRKPRSTIRA